MSATIKDIAAELGISPSTVSRALNDHPQINKETKKAVQAMAKKLRYQVNKMASGLRTNRSYSIGVIVPRVGEHFFASILSGIHDAVSDSGYQIFVCQSNESTEDERRYIETLSAGRVDGLLISMAVGDNSTSHISESMENGMPIVLFDRVSRELKTQKVKAEDYQGSFLVTEHLIRQGCSDILCLSGSDHLLNVQERLQGHYDAMKKYKIPVREANLVDCDFVPAMAREFVLDRYASGSGPDGIFSMNDAMATEAILALKSLKIRIPEDVAVAGFGDFPEGRIVEPNLTTVGHHPYEIGRLAAICLIREINGQSVREDVSHIVKSNLIIRDSSRRSD